MKKEAVLSSETIFKQVGDSAEPLSLSLDPSAPELGVYAAEGNWWVRHSSSELRDSELLGIAARLDFVGERISFDEGDAGASLQ